MKFSVCFPAALLIAFSLSNASVAAPPDAVSSASASLLQAAQRQADNVEERYKAGAASVEERDQAQTTLALAKVQVQRQDALALLERQQQKVKAGALPASELPKAELAVLACDVAAKQVVLEQRQRAVARTNELHRGGVVPQADVDTASVAMETARLELEQIKAKYKVAKLAYLKQRIGWEKQNVEAGRSSRADLQKAQAEYEAAKSL